MVSLHQYLPFDPSIVLNKLPSISTEIPSEESGLVITANTVESSEACSTESCPMFSYEELELFQRHFENGYTLFFDEKYVRWLQYHPDSVLSVAESFSTHFLPEPCSAVHRYATRCVCN